MLAFFALVVSISAGHAATEPVLFGMAEDSPYSVQVKFQSAQKMVFWEIGQNFMTDVAGCQGAFAEKDGSFSGDIDCGNVSPRWSKVALNIEFQKINRKSDLPLYDDLKKMSGEEVERLFGKDSPIPAVNVHVVGFRQQPLDVRMRFVRLNKPFIGARR